MLLWHTSEVASLERGFQSFRRRLASCAFKTGSRIQLLGGRVAKTEKFSDMTEVSAAVF